MSAVWTARRSGLVMMTDGSTPFFSIVRALLRKKTLPSEVRYLSSSLISDDLSTAAA
jgi:hypothetical protein